MGEMIPEQGRQLYVLRNMVALSRNHCCNGNPTVRSVTIIEVHVTVNFIDMYGFDKRCFYVEFLSPSTIKLSEVSRKVPDIFVRF
jgi:hypothetical protein